MILLFQGVSRQQWYLFNDFLIEPIEQVRILDKIPACLFMLTLMCAVI